MAARGYEFSLSAALSALTSNVLFIIWILIKFPHKRQLFLFSNQQKVLIFPLNEFFNITFRDFCKF